MRLGQHFLIDDTVAEKIVSALELNYNDTVLEIGAGKGMLSKKIVGKVKKLYLVELDNKLCNLLLNKLYGCQNFEIINEDFLKLDLTKFVSQENKLKIVGNIPYSITSAILHKIYAVADSVWKVCVLMLQKEVAEKLVAQPNTSSFSKLTLITNFYTKTEFLFEVSKESFTPKPKVTSAVVRFFPNYEFVNYKLKDTLLKLIDFSFQHKRKTVLNSISMCLKIDKSLIKKLVENSGINLDCRAHQLGLDDYIKLTEKLSKIINQFTNCKSYPQSYPQCG